MIVNTTQTHNGGRPAPVDFRRSDAAPQFNNGPLPVDPAGIPEVMRVLPAWVGWTLRQRDRGKASKIPVNIRTGQPADITSPAAWVGFDDALVFANEHQLSGIGFVLSGRHDVAAVDLDGVIDRATGTLDPFAAEVVRDLDSFTELSPSGTGLHVFALGRLEPGGRHRAGRLELYDDRRFIAMTGHRLPETRPTVEPREAVLRRLQAAITPHRRPRPDASTNGGGFFGTDKALLAIAFAAKNGRRTRDVWEGRVPYGSASEALLGLARRLAWFSGPDPVRLERLVTASPLFAATEDERAKWWADRRGDTWGQRYVIRVAIDSCPGFYQPWAGAAAGQNTVQDCVRVVPTLDPTFPTPRNPVGEALRRVESGERPPGLERIVRRRVDAQAGLRQLAAVCWVLAGRKPGGEFVLSVEAAARALGVGTSSISRRIRQLQLAGCVRRVTWGNSITGKSSVWRWNGIRPVSRGRGNRQQPVVASE